VISVHTNHRGCIMINYFSVLLICLFLLIPTYNQADEINMWQDSKGVWHMSDQPPDFSQPVKKYSTHKYKANSQSEINKFKAKEKSRLQATEALRKYNESQDELRKTNESWARQNKQIEKDRLINKKKAEIDDLVDEKKRYNKYENDSYFIDNKNYYHDKATETGKEITKKQSELLDLENAK